MTKPSRRPAKPRRIDQEPVVRIVWHQPTPWQARELIAAMDRHIEAQQKAAGKTAA